MKRIFINKLFVIFFIFIFFPNQLIFSTPSKLTSPVVTLSSSESAIRVNEKLAMRVQVADQKGNPLAYQLLNISFEGVSGRFLPDAQSIRSDKNGQATIIWQAGLNPGKVAIKATLPNYGSGISAQSTRELAIEPIPLEEETGRISITMSKECALNATVEIYDKMNKLVLTLSSDSAGLFDTGCTLVCNEYYFIKPVKKNCRFNPPQVPVQAKCCPAAGTFDFSCECEAETTGKIAVKIPETCTKDTIIKILDSTGKQVSTIPAPNSNGVYENPCDLVCGQTYTVVPYNPGCQFSPASKTVTAKCCPEFGFVSFDDCSCSGETKDGKLIVKLPQDCAKNTVIRISLPDSTKPIYLYPDSEGTFDTGCVLKCGDMYRIEPYNTSCKFSPSVQYVKAACCAESVIPPVSFLCSCTSAKTGKIGVKVPLNCITGTKIYVTELSGTYVTQLTTANAEGLFESTCTLVCGATYKVTPVNNNSCKFNPAYLTVTAKCCPEPFEIATFTDCTCPPLKTGKIKVALPTNALSGTKVLIYDKAGTLVTNLSSYTSSGVFESTCTLTCDETYTVKPYSATCTFTPETMTVVAKCCPSYGFVNFTSADCQKQKGSIVIKLPPDCTPKTTIRITTVATVGTPIYLSANASGVFDTGCVLYCGDSYRVEPIGAGCTYTPTYQIVKASCCTATPPVPITFACSCGSANNGKIAVQIPVEALKGTKIYVTLLNGTYVAQLTTANDKGLFESDCILVCGTTYKVTVANPTCTFSPNYKTVTAKCCPEYGLVAFTQYTCPPVKNGKIAVKVPLSCLTGTKIYIQQIGGTYTSYLATANADGVFESDCNLTCGVSFKVTPVNPTCKFSPAYLSVTAKCCPEFGQVEFLNCTCPPPKTGKIAVKIPQNCLSGTKIYVTELNGTYVTQLTSTNAEGLFESTCTLVCGATYKVTPANPTCKFEPSYLSVTAKCCPEFNTVEFTKCTCPPAKTGKIKVQIPINCVSGTRIYLIDSKGVGIVLTSGNGSTGVFESTCTLICDETYTVQPVNSYYTFSPASQKVIAKCCPTYGYASFNGTRKTSFIGYFWARRYDLEAI